MLSNSPSILNSSSFSFSIYASFGSSDFLISAVRKVSTCLAFCRSDILNLYSYSFFSLALRVSYWSFISF